jgi:hypothetical protein
MTKPTREEARAGYGRIGGRRAQRQAPGRPLAVGTY